MDKSENYTFLNNEQIKCLNSFGFRYNRHKRKYEKIVYSGIYKFVLHISITILPIQNKYGTKELRYPYNIIPMKKYQDTYVLITNDSDKTSEEYITEYNQQSAYISIVINKLKRLYFTNNERDLLRTYFLFLYSQNILGNYIHTLAEEADNIFDCKIEESENNRKYIRESIKKAYTFGNYILKFGVPKETLESGTFRKVRNIIRENPTNITEKTALAEIPTYQNIAGIDMNMDSMTVNNSYSYLHAAPYRFIGFYTPYNSTKIIGSINDTDQEYYYDLLNRIEDNESMLFTKNQIADTTIDAITFNGHLQIRNELSIESDLFGAVFAYNISKSLYDYASITVYTTKGVDLDNGKDILKNILAAPTYNDILFTFIKFRRNKKLMSEPNTENNPSNLSNNNLTNNWTMNNSELICMNNISTYDIYKYVDNKFSINLSAIVDQSNVVHSEDNGKIIFVRPDYESVFMPNNSHSSQYLFRTVINKGIPFENREQEYMPEITIESVLDIGKYMSYDETKSLRTKFRNIDRINIMDLAEMIFDEVNVLHPNKPIVPKILPKQ